MITSCRELAPPPSFPILFVVDTRLLRSAALLISKLISRYRDKQREPRALYVPNYQTLFENSSGGNVSPSPSPTFACFCVAWSNHRKKVEARSAIRWWISGRWYRSREMQSTHVVQFLSLSPFLSFCLSRCELQFLDGSGLI